MKRLFIFSFVLVSVFVQAQNTPPVAYDQQSKEEDERSLKAVVEKFHERE